jgi:vacuolar-type H+-ATPase catalytic subunit A/Vma1
VKVVSYVERPDLLERRDELGAAWDEFMYHDAVANARWNGQYEEFSDLQLFLLDEDDRLLAESNAVPVPFGPDALPESEKIILEVARMLREDYLQQFAFDAVDAYCPPKKSYWILRSILAFYDAATQAMSRGVSLRQIMQIPMRDEISTLKTTDHERAIERMQEMVSQISDEIAGIEVL